MKLLFDENLSPRLADLVRDAYPDCVHAHNVGLQGATDQAIWEYARDHGLIIVSKDDDFRQRSFLQGAPPKVVWLQVGNAGTTAIAELLRREKARVRAFEGDDESSLLILSVPHPAA